MRSSLASRRGRAPLDPAAQRPTVQVEPIPLVLPAGDSYDNDLAESVIGLYKTEVIRRRGPWHHLEAVEIATLDWVDWFNHRRLLTPIGHVPPAEFQQQYYLTQAAPVMTAGVN